MYTDSIESAMEMKKMTEYGRDGIKQDRLDMDSRHGADFTKSRWDRAMAWRKEEGKCGEQPVAQLWVRTDRVGTCGQKSGRRSKKG